MAKNQTQAPVAQERELAPQTQFPPMELDVRIRPVGKGNLMAYASMNINKAFAVDGIRVINGEKGMFVAMPSVKGSDGQYRDVCFPIRKEFRAQIQDAVLGEYQQTLQQMQEAAQQREEEAPAPAPEPEQAPAPAMSM